MISFISVVKYPMRMCVSCRTVYMHGTWVQTGGGTAGVQLYFVFRNTLISKNCVACVKPQRVAYLRKVSLLLPLQVNKKPLCGYSSVINTFITVFNKETVHVNVLCDVLYVNYHTTEVNDHDHGNERRIKNKAAWKPNVGDLNLMTVRKLHSISNKSVKHEILCIFALTDIIVTNNV